MSSSSQTATGSCQFVSSRPKFLLTFLLISIYSQKFQTVESKPVKFASPLQSLTIPDGKAPPSPRSNFLFKFKAGIESERRARKEIAAEAKRQRQYEIGIPPPDSDIEIDDEDEDFFESSKWAEMSAEKFDNYKDEKRKKISAAFDEGFASGAAMLDSAAAKAVDAPTAKSSNEYQFVGVVQNGKKVKWYARSKPKDSSWSVRMINVDKAAVLRDLFVRGKIDIYGEYENKGVLAAPSETEDSNNEQPTASVPLVQAKYTVKERSLKTLWNFSPKALFTDRSGMYWRQRRLSPGIFTDGNKVYETTYHYSEGRNGMKVVSESLEEYIQKNPDISKEKLMEKMNGGTKPDLVLEY